MSKILLVSDLKESGIKTMLKHHGHDVDVVCDYDHVRPFLDKNPDTKLIVWEPVVKHVKISKNGYIWEVQALHEGVTNVGVYASPHWKGDLLKAGCEEVFHLPIAVENINRLCSFK